MRLNKNIRKRWPIISNKAKRSQTKSKKNICRREQILNNFGVAIIGSRNSSREGEKITEEIVTKLVKKDIVIISGLAKGIDGKAHQTCINNGGTTIAVIGSGFDNIYPKENKKIYKEIIEISKNKIIEDEEF